jgi:hypothetical protein
MSQQKTAKSPLKWLSLDKEGRASRHEGSFRKFFGTDIDENGNTIEEAGDDQGEARVLEWADLPRSVLKLGNDGELRRSCIVYGDNLEEATVFGQMFLKISQDQQEEVRLRKCHLEEAVAFPEEKGEELSGDRQERRREEIGTRSIPRVSRMHISREVNGQQLISLSTKMPGASSSLNARGHLSATFDAGTNEVEDDDIRCRKLLQSGAPPGSETNWRCEACGVERSVYIQDRAQSRVAYSVTAARMSGRTEGGFLNPFLAPLPRGSQHRRDRRRRPGLPETRSG